MGQSLMLLWNPGWGGGIPGVQQVLTSGQARFYVRDAFLKTSPNFKLKEFRTNFPVEIDTK